MIPAYYSVVCSLNFFAMSSSVPLPLSQFLEEYHGPFDSPEWNSFFAAVIIVEAQEKASIPQGATLFQQDYLTAIITQLAQQ